MGVFSVVGEAAYYTVTHAREILTLTSSARTTSYVYNSSPTTRGVSAVWATVYGFFLSKINWVRQGVKGLIATHHANRIEGNYRRFRENGWETSNVASYCSNHLALFELYMLENPPINYALPAVLKEMHTDLKRERHRFRGNFPDKALPWKLQIFTYFEDIALFFARGALLFLWKHRIIGHSPSSVKTIPPLDKY